jgi:hypothetical protein
MLQISCGKHIIWLAPISIMQVPPVPFNQTYMLFFKIFDCIEKRSEAMTYIMSFLLYQQLKICCTLSMSETCLMYKLNLKEKAHSLCVRMVDFIAHFKCVWTNYGLQETVHLK